MFIDCVSYRQSGYFSPLINDYLDQKPNLKSLYNRFPTIKNFKEQLIDKQQNFDQNHRRVLVAVLQKQYKKTTPSALARKNIDLLLESTTFTITTGHQLNLFTGPLYFLYKIITTINLTKELKAAYPEFNFVPVYWMATEDHDFEEINHFNFKGKKIVWDKNNSGPVGRLNTIGLKDVFQVFANELGIGENASVIRKMFEESYLSFDNLADATRHLVNRLFSIYGLVILDSDSADLKRQFIPYIKEELINQTTHKEVLKTTQKLKNYNIQVQPRTINLFYLEDNLRERIVFEKNQYYVNNTTISFSEIEILDRLEKHPEKFSPNVIMRPLYQEVILPNLCYIGGGGELAYWLELKSYFERSKIIFPILLLRNSLVLATEKQADKLDRLHLKWKDLFLKKQDLIVQKTKKLSEFPTDLLPQKQFLRNQFEQLFELAAKTDFSFTGALKAQERKQIKGLENLEKRLLRAQKRKFKEQLDRIVILHEELFPSDGLQERTDNFSKYYLLFGESMIKKLTDELRPLEQHFNIVVL